MGLAGFRRNGSAWGDGDGGLILTCFHFSFIHSSSLVCANLPESSLPSRPIASVSYRIVSRIGYYMHPLVFLSFIHSFFLLPSSSSSFYPPTQFCDSWILSLSLPPPTTLSPALLSPPSSFLVSIV